MQIERSLRLLSLMNFLFENVEMLKWDPLSLLLSSSRIQEFKETIFAHDEVISSSERELSDVHLFIHSKLDAILMR